MASDQAITKATALLAVAWPAQVEDKASTVEGLALLRMLLADTEDRWLEAGVQRTLRRLELRSSDNLGEILRSDAQASREAWEKLKARQDGERRHAQALVDLAKDTGPRLLAAALKPGNEAKRPFHVWLRDNLPTLEAEPDPLTRTSMILGAIDHTLPDEIRETMIRLVGAARDRRAPKRTSQATSHAAASAEAETKETA